MKVIDDFGVKNQYVIRDIYQDKTSFQSYNSLIAEFIEHKGCIKTLVLYQDFDYSNTTSKYLHKYLYNYVDICIYEFIKKNVKELKEKEKLTYHHAFTEISIIYKENE